MSKNIKNIYSDKDFRKYVGRKKVAWRVLIGFGAFFFIIGIGLAGVKDSSASVALMGGLTCIIVGCIFIHRVKRRCQAVRKYVPQKEFSFYRKTASERIKKYSIFEVILAVLIAAFILCMITRFSINHLFTAVGDILLLISPIIYLQYMKHRIKFHENIDDATYFELEELGILSDIDIVKSLYKDFETWESVNENDKILIVTQDAFICVRFTNRYEATQFKLPLSQFDKLGILRVGKYLEGFLLTLGFHEQYLRIRLSGKSFQDSPEEFLAFFLNEMDDRMLQKPYIAKERPCSSAKSGKTYQNHPPINIRNLDFDTYGGEVKNNASQTGKSRILDL